VKYRRGGRLVNTLRYVSYLPRATGSSIAAATYAPSSRTTSRYERAAS
jgi:hypothetical protein